MNEFMKVGRYQLENLLRNQIRFLFVDLSKSGQRSAESLFSNAVHFDFTKTRNATSEATRAVQIERDRLLEFVQEKAADFSAAILLVCEDGDASEAAADLLAKHNYINVFVLEGGHRSVSGSH